jgi:transposase-like protein/IS1 family transposase
MENPPETMRCPHATCPSTKSAIPPTFVRHSFLRTGTGKKQRWRCKSCGGTFTRNTGTIYHRLRFPAHKLDLALTMTLEGASQAAICRALEASRSTVGRWLDRAASHARTFNETIVKGVDAYELQADEIRSFGQGRGARSWVFNTIEVWSRLWLSTRTGSRTLANCLALLRDSRRRCIASTACVLISTDGYPGYPSAVRQAWGPSCCHGVTNKIFRGGQIRRVHHHHVLGAEWQFEAAFERSEDSEDLNTAYIERLNLFIRRALVCLHRRTSSALQSRTKLEDLIELLRCYYNFVRRHGALKFGREVRTPAQQAGLVTRRLSFRDILTAFRPGSRVRWISDRRRRAEWQLVSWAATLGATCTTARRAEVALAG